PAAAPPPRRERRVRRGRLLAVVATVLVLLIAGIAAQRALANATAPTSTTPLRQAIVKAADSQLGYRTTPQNTFCNRFSAYWGAGQDCGNGTSAEEWCADFAAWTWRQAGVAFSYGYGPGQLNGGAISFYQWALQNGTWHAVGGGYQPQPGDVAVYGVNGAATWAAHVAVVTGHGLFTNAPNVVNGDGDETGFSVVESGTAETRADTKGSTGALAGYASPVGA
ncbi:MAG: CHAP domain-containing protein, partial [Candidatus Dormiibacterota bacterium]